MKKFIFVILFITISIFLNSLGTLRVESIKELPATHMNLEVRDADGKWAPVLIVKTELKGLGFKNVSHPTKHAAEYNTGKHEYKFYMNDNQRVVDITHADYEPLEVRLLADFSINVKAKRVYEMVLTNVPEKEFIIVNILSDPPDAEKIVDGENLGIGQSFKLFIGKHTLKVQKEGYKSQTKNITVSESSMLFEDIKLEEIDILAVQISSVPQGAIIYIDNQEQGVTDKGIFKYPGTYELKLTKTDYLDIDEQTTRDEQGDDFNVWLDKCLSRFNDYETDKSLHLIWKNLAKVIFTDEERTNCLRSKLQNKLVNLDWCFYYSKKFTTVAQNAENKDIYELFDNNLNRLLKKINPKVIFAHGKSLDNWFRSNSTDIEEILKLEHGSKTYKLFSGCLKNLSIPIIYQEWFINRGNKNTNLEQVRKLLKQYM